MASAAVDLLIIKIVSVIENEALLVGGVCDELGDLKKELVSMRSFLEVADTKRALTEGEKSWAADVREMAYNVEDIIDEFMYYMSMEQGGGRLRRLFYKIIHIPKNLWVRHCIATKVQKIKRMITDISERNQRYAFHHIEGTSSHDDHRWVKRQGESSLFVKDDVLVGIEDDRQLLVRLLTDGKPQRAVISVVGMGGSGKTTLVAKAYKSEIVKRHFDCCTWITVSQTYDIEDLLKNMIKEIYLAMKEAIPMELSTMRYKQLLEMLVNYLGPKRYVIVLDDVWSGDLWRDLYISLPDEGIGSRVILATRKQDIASSSFGVKSHVHHLQPLRMNEAWDLFCMKAFSSSSNRSCPQELEIIARGLVEKCEGLPLAIVSLGGLMSSKSLESEWRKVYNSLNWQLSNNKELDRMKTILLLSFNDMPYRLKRCFLYCCLSPEDYLIRRKRLIRLWMAEGFVEKVKGITPEEVAEDYLMELVCRSMLQVVKRNPLGRPKICKMHDLMRELALSTSETDKFCGVYDGEEASEENRARRLSVQTSDGGEIKTWKGMSQLRSLLVFAVDIISPSQKTLPLGFRLLRVLDLEDVPIVTLPDELVNLFNLRYLNLKRTKVKMLPKSIGRLHNLQTLDIRDSKIDILPAGITQLQNLRHMVMYRYNHGDHQVFDYVHGTPAPLNICKLKYLQVMACVEAETGLMKSMKHMTQLTRIGITKVKEEDEKDLCISIQNMNLLRYLFVMVKDDEEYLRMDELSLAPPCLKTLILVGKLEKVPSWFHSLQSLTHLRLHWSRLEEDVLHYIQTLPNLGSLTS